MLLGSATVLLPIYAKDILQVGPGGLGWLAAGPAIGAVLMGVTQGYRRPWLHAGRAFTWGAAIFGAATLAIVAPGVRLFPELSRLRGIESG